jgi:hypothetical protein
MTSRRKEIQQQSFVILAQERPMLSFNLCKILPLTLQTDERTGRAPEQVSLRWESNPEYPIVQLAA